MSRRHLELLLTAPGHLCELVEHRCRFGDTWKPVCIEDDCHYVGPFVNRARAQEIASEHRLKTVKETW